MLLPTFLWFVIKLLLFLVALVLRPCYTYYNVTKPSNYVIPINVLRGTNMTTTGLSILMSINILFQVVLLGKTVLLFRYYKTVMKANRLSLDINEQLTSFKEVNSIVPARNLLKIHAFGSIATITLFMLSLYLFGSTPALLIQLVAPLVWFKFANPTVTIWTERLNRALK